MAQLYLPVESTRLANTKQALAIDPNNADALTGAALMYYLDYVYELGPPGTNYEEKVLGKVERAIALAPNNASAYDAMSFYLNSSGRSNEGLRAADLGLAIDPNSAALFNARAYAEINLGQFDKAKSDIARAMRLSPRDPRMSLWRTNLADAEMRRPEPTHGSRSICA